MSNRNQTLDIVKAIAIILMVFGHSIQLGSGSAYDAKLMHLDNPVFQLIYSFHMPLFMLISGYLFAFSAKKGTWKGQILKKVNALLVPLLSWTFVSFCILMARRFMHQTPSTVLSVVKLFFSTLQSNLWFLWALFYCSLFVIIARQFFNDHPAVYLIAFLLTFVTPDYFGFSMYKFMYPYFVLGYFFCKEMILQRYSEQCNSCWVVILSGICFAALLPFYNRNAFVYVVGYHILRDRPWYWLVLDIYRFVIGLMGSVFVIAVCRKTAGRFPLWLSQDLSFIGQRTMGIYIVSSYLFSFVTRIFTDGFSGLNYCYALIETTLVIAVSLLGTEIIRRIPIANRLLLGGR